MTAGWGEPRPTLVGIGGFLLIAAGVVELLVAALFIALYAAPALLIAAPMTALGIGGVLFGFRMRSGRDRVPAMATAFLISVSAPFTLSVFLATVTVVSTLITLVALIRHRVWFVAPPDLEPPGD